MGNVLGWGIGAVAIGGWGGIWNGWYNFVNCRMEKEEEKKPMKKLAALLEFLKEEGEKELAALRERQKPGPDGKMTPFPQEKYCFEADLD